MKKADPRTALRIIGPSVGLVLLLLAGAWALSGDFLRQEKPGSLLPSRKIGYFSYLSEDNSTALLVDVELARMRKAEKYIPLAVKLANKGLKTLKIQRSSWVLLDPAEAAYSMPGFKALEADYKPYSADARYYARKIFTEGDLQTSFSSFHKLPCSFFPHPYKDSLLHDVLIEDVEIPQGNFIEDLIYFPRPKEEAPGQVFRLRLLNDKLEPYAEVGFVIDEPPAPAASSQIRRRPGSLW
jgi:hypothetical protein